MTANPKKPFLPEEHLFYTLNGLVITFAERVDGKSFLVYTESEPFFCIEQDTEEKAKNVAREIIVSYAKLHGVDVKPADLVFSERERVSITPRKPRYILPVEERINPIRQFISPILHQKKKEKEAVA